MPSNAHVAVARAGMTGPLGITVRPPPREWSEAILQGEKGARIGGLQRPGDDL